MSAFRCSPLFSEKEAAVYLGVSLSTIRRWRRANRGPGYFRFGDVLRYAQDGLDTFIAANTHSAELRG